jgi:flavodoxin
MKSLIVYYSYSGNTQKVAYILAEYLRQKVEADIIELEPLDESDKFFPQAIRAFGHKRAQLQPVNCDLSAYGLICFGTPVWAFGPAPAMNTYLDDCFGLEDKAVILFTTYGSGTGNRRCLNYMQDILAKKGAQSFSRFSIQQSKVENKEFVLSKIKEAMRL